MREAKNTIIDKYNISFLTVIVSLAAVGIFKHRTSQNEVREIKISGFELPKIELKSELLTLETKNSLPGLSDISKTPNIPKTLKNPEKIQNQTDLQKRIHYFTTSPIINPDYKKLPVPTNNKTIPLEQRDHKKNS